MFAVPTLEDRLHLLAPVTTIGAPLVGAGLIVYNGLTLTSGQIALIVAILAITGPSITVAVARANRQRENSTTEEPE
jgi:multicomponent Na+:H+ antiporter subunit G